MKFKTLSDKTLHTTYFSTTPWKMRINKAYTH